MLRINRNYKKLCNKQLLITLCRSRVWKGMKVLRPNSITLGTRKLWWIFPIKQKFDTTTAFLDNAKCSVLSNLTIFLTVFSEASRCTMVKKLSPNWTSFKRSYYKKAAVVSNFCLIVKIRHNFLVPRMIELGRKTFMPIQTLDIHRVIIIFE